MDTIIETLKACISETIRSEFSKFIPPTTPPASPGADELLTRKETAARLNITLATLHQYTLSGKIAANRIGNRVLYKESDIQNALRQVQTSTRA